ncbi:hypothetical protein C8Q77DRAFT_325849 [Trametes polyzona]|nr:hypothetical protein C8Q77DRAFT_325849 [Trametes polyzona]
MLLTSSPHFNFVPLTKSKGTTVTSPIYDITLSIFESTMIISIANDQRMNA